MEGVSTAFHRPTVYPRVKRELLAPTTEAIFGSGLRNEFFIDHSPERSAPSDEDRGLSNFVRILRGQNETSIEDITVLDVRANESKGVLMRE